MNGVPAHAAPAGRDNLVGALLVVGALIVGVVLLAKGYDEEGAIVRTDGGAAEETTDSPPTTAGPADTTPATTAPAAPVARPPAEVTVFVANAAGVSGAAGTLRTELTGEGYTQVQTGNASPVTSTSVYYAEGAEAEAAAVATAIGADPTNAVRALPANPPVSTGGAMVLVMLGPDLAS